MTSHYPDLGSASDCLKKISLARSIRSTTQIRVATLHQCGLFATFSFLRRHFAGKPLAWDQATKWGGGGGREAKNGVKQQKQMTPAGSLHESIIFSAFFVHCGALSQARELVVASRDIVCFFRLILESFRFKDEDDYEYEIQLNVFSRTVEKHSAPESFIVQFFTRKISRVTFVGEGLALSGLQNDFLKN